MWEIAVGIRENGKKQEVSSFSKDDYGNSFKQESMPGLLEFGKTKRPYMVVLGVYTNRRLIQWEEDDCA